MPQSLSKIHGQEPRPAVESGPEVRSPDQKRKRKGTMETLKVLFLHCLVPSLGEHFVHVSAYLFDEYSVSCSHHLNFRHLKIRMNWTK